MNAETLTQKIHARADRKLNLFLQSRFGEMFDLCGGHGSDKRPKLEDFPNVNLALKQCRMPEVMPWSGSAIELSRAVCFAYMRDQWREREMEDFIKKVEGIHGICCEEVES
jgi:hypothetical protein